MKYELINTAEPGYIVPPWAPGYDRLNYYNPAPHARELLIKNISNGGLSRYVEYDDHSESTEIHTRVHTIFNTLESAQEMQNLVRTFPTLISTEIVERPDL
jgi:hypothetical protein